MASQDISHSRLGSARARASELPLIRHRHPQGRWRLPSLPSINFDGRRTHLLHSRIPRVDFFPSAPSNVLNDTKNHRYCCLPRNQYVFVFAQLRLHSPLPAPHLRPSNRSLSLKHASRNQLRFIFTLCLQASKQVCRRAGPADNRTTSGQSVERGVFLSLIFQKHKSSLFPLFPSSSSFRDRFNDTHIHTKPLAQAPHPPSTQTPPPCDPSSPP